MELTNKDLELLVNEQNKVLYDTVYDIILKEFENAISFTDLTDMTEIKNKTLGTCGIYLSSIVELLHGVRYLIAQGFVESGGILAASAWERALTFRKILLEPEKNAQIHTEHEKAKKTPWTVWDMVNEVIKNERARTGTAIRAHEARIFYLQYTFLCSIKHGNPYTVSYLNRPDRSTNEKLFQLKSNDSDVDRDLKIYIKMLAADNALDALIDYSREFRTRVNWLLDLRQQVDQLTMRVPILVPQIFITDPSEMGEDFWQYLLQLEEQRRRESNS
ncbi:hypothetical protein [Mucilaginibacter sp. BT774]|uniref:hypothetical protein n=1 Tax=Mucilaginibacter sp. BT774 TaxID=3062276 RepID=UPI0026773ECF|nr:hypothetical protein [Mucilaginibacter sp. BT774]MDO3627598.1 hypothetical protein [Mucilaginibacter sp. BT774]